MSKCISKQENGKLEDIDAVLGCPIWMVTEDTYDKLESLTTQELNILCDANFYCLNFFRELVNTFSESTDEEDKKKVIIRLKNICHVQDKLKKILASNPGYHPPTMLYLEDQSGWQPPVIGVLDSKGKGGGKKKGGKKKGAAALQDVTNSQVSQLANDTATMENDPNESPKEAIKIDLDAYTPFYREWDMSVFKILTFNVLNIGSIPDLEEEVKDPKLRPREFLMIMKDLNTKLSHILVANVMKKNFPGKTKATVGFSNLDQIGALIIAKRVVPLIENILADAEVIAEYFKSLINLYDGRTSTELYKDDNFAIFNTCLEQVFQCLKTILSWNGFNQNTNLLKHALGYFANRLGKVNPEKMRIKDLAKKALEYLDRFTQAQLSIDVASVHLKLLEIIDNLGDLQSPLIHKTSEEYLTRPWFSKGKTAEKGAKYNGIIESFLALYLKTAKTDQEALNIIKLYVSSGLKQLLDKDHQKEDEDEFKFETLNKQNILNHYR